MFKQGRNVLENEKINVFSQNSNKFSLDNHTLFFLYLEQLNNNLRGTQKRDVVATKEQVLLPGVSPIVGRNSCNETHVKNAALLTIKNVSKPPLMRYVDIEARDQRNLTPLHYAAISNNKEAAEFFLQHNAAIEARAEENLTPLHVAAQYNNTEVAQLLFQRNADIEAKSELT